MNGTPVSRVIHILSDLSSHRRVFATLSALSVFRVGALDATSQIEISACNAEGDICPHQTGSSTGLISTK